MKKTISILMAIFILSAQMSVLAESGAGNLSKNSADKIEIYFEDFSSGDLSKWKHQSKAYDIAADEEHGNYLSLAPGGNDRGVYTLLETSGYKFDEYVYECDVRLKAGNTRSSQIVLMAEDYAFGSGNINYGISSGYIMKLNTEKSEEWTINPDTDNKTVEIPKTDWVHIIVSADKSKTWLEITDGENVLYEGEITPSSQKAIPVGFSMRGGKSNAVMDVDNISLKINKIFNGYSVYKNNKNVGVIVMPGFEENVYAVLYNGDGTVSEVKKTDNAEKYQILEFSVPEDSGSYIKIFNWDSAMKPWSQPSDIVYVDEIKDTVSDYILDGKDIYAFGDSIVYGHNAPEKSFTRIIADEYNMNLTMGAVNGASVIKSSNHILTQIKNAPNEAPDIILFDGYTNDAYGAVGSDKFNTGGHADVNEHIGEILGSTESVFDNSTFCGGFEEIIYTMKQKWPGTPIVFVTIHKSGGRDWDVQCKLRELAIDMCNEWSVDVVDIFEKATLDTRDEEQMKQYIIGGKGSHPNEKGCREFYIPPVKEKLKEILGNSVSLPDNLAETVDVAVFAGQSNMSGRGDAEEGVVCDINAGFEYKSVSNPNTLVPIKEPFGIGEERDGGIADYDSSGKTKRTGSMVSAVADEYYKQTGRQLVAVSASVGGTSTDEWKSKYINDAVLRLDDTIKFLAKNNINTGRIFIVWCQGETDGDNKVDAQTYVENTKYLFNEFKKHGANECFVIQTGHYNYIDYPENGDALDSQYGVIRDAQEALCEEEDGFFMAASFEGYIDSMKDRYHYNQAAYNEVGRTAGKTIAKYFEN